MRTHAPPAPLEAAPTPTRGFRLATFSSVRYHNFRYLLGVTFFVSAGNWIQQVTLGWFVFEVTKSAFLTGATMGLGAVPTLLIGPLAGVAIDRLNRKLLLIANQVFLGVVSLAFAFVVRAGLVEKWWDPGNLWSGWPFFAFAGVMGAGWAVSNPVRQALVAMTVPKQALLNAFSLNSSVFNLMRIAGPAAGGLLIAAFGPATNFFIQAVTSLVVIAIILPMRVPTTSPAGTPGRERRDSFVADLMEGLKYVMKEPTLRVLILLAIVPSMSMFPFVQGLMPVFAKDVLHEGPEGLGLLLASAGVGSMLATLGLASWHHLRHIGAVQITSATLAAVGVAIFSQTSSLPMSLVVLAAMSGVQMMYFATNNTIIQTITPDQYRGRVLSIYLLSHGFAPVGSFAAGALAEALGAPGAILVAGLFTTLFLLYVALRFKLIWRLQV